MTDLSLMISFTSFQAYYANVGPAAVEKTSGVDVLFFTYLSNISYSSRNHLLKVDEPYGGGFERKIAVLDN